MTHADLHAATAQEVRWQIEESNRILSEVSSGVVSFFRPPWGHRTDASDAICKSVGQAVILYTLDSRDWEHGSAQQSADRLLARAVDGDVLLLHDTLPSVVQATELVVAGFARQGIDIVSVSSLFGHTVPGAIYRGLESRSVRLKRKLAGVTAELAKRIHR